MPPASAGLDRGTVRKGAATTIPVHALPPNVMLVLAVFPSAATNPLPVMVAVKGARVQLLESTADRTEGKAAGLVGKGALTSHISPTTEVICGPVH